MSVTKNYIANVVIPTEGGVGAVLSDGLLTVTKRMGSGEGENNVAVFSVPAASKEEATDILRAKGVTGDIEWAEQSVTNFAEGQPGQVQTTDPLAFYRGETDINPANPNSGGGE